MQQTSSGPSSRRVNMAMPIRPLVHVANLPATTAERDLREMFGSLGQIQSARVVTNRSAGGLAYGFVEYVDVASAERAIRTMDGWLWFGTPIKVRWAKHSLHPDAAAEPMDAERPVAMRSANAGLCHLFVGDLAPEVDDGSFRAFFAKYASLADVRVMYDPETGKSRGFGFITLRSKQEAVDCIATMQGKLLCGRQIRVNWANQKNQQGQAPTTPSSNPSSPYSPIDPTLSRQQLGGLSSRSSTTPSVRAADVSTRITLLPRRHTTLASQPQLSTITTNPANVLKYSYDAVLSEAPSSQTSVYVGNISPLTSQPDLIRIFAPFNHGQPLEARIPPGRGYGFVTLASHEQAASAICTLSIQGVFMHSRWLRFGWQKDRHQALPKLQHRSESAPEHMLYTLQKPKHPPPQPRPTPHPQQQNPPPPSSSSSSNEFQPF
ncbi:Nuclear and cytoplasmic polyadenylated RNA-binding protein PUB1 [Pseudozyma hubeiensis]|nr:Nuclear and cytoplasmic polyadenylated RNA-binding protein PUB1 [Pseudozyma hubeiensis]